jgi:hypothetical protein
MRSPNGCIKSTKEPRLFVLQASFTSSLAATATTGQNDRAIVSRGVCWNSDGDIVGDLDTGAGDPGGRPGSGLDAASTIVPFTILAAE